jgi:uncharacterized protein YbcC (UPF0753/DUF2309 family)
MTRNDDAMRESIERAAESVGAVWPLHSFVTANPLSGFEDRPFPEAVAEGERLFGGRGYPRAAVFRRAYEEGRIDPDVLAAELDSQGISDEPGALLDEMAAVETEQSPAVDPATERVDRVLSKWLAAFLDQGQAEWSMPNRERGFYAAWRTLAPHDDEIPNCDSPSDLPDTGHAALEAAVGDIPHDRLHGVFEHHLAALPGWTGFVKHRNEDEGPWQAAAPISLLDYLAVRLTLADLLDAPIVPTGQQERPVSREEPPLPEIWLTAWERTYRNRLLDGVDQSVTHPTAHNDGSRPAAQLVFCIDTRSEVIRRHVESVGPYETHGYAGFFGVPMRFEAYDAATESEACPPIVESQHRVADRPDADRGDEQSTHDRWTDLVAATRKHLKSLKSNVAAAFTFVEGGGSAYGAAMTARTLLPSAVASAANAIDDHVQSPAAFCSPTVNHEDNTNPRTDGDAHDGSRPEGMTFEERVEYAATAFDLMGWETFARLVVFTGHASETTNNPFDSSLDCGACAGNPGGPNARVLATICNDEGVQTALRERGFDVPADTVFVGAEHNTTTDEITLFDSDVPESHEADLQRLRADLEDARAAAAAERAESMQTRESDPVRETERRTADWAETRPEWGLAGNASFVIGPRELTDDQHLDGRAFLHSYDWTTDPEGDALEAIVAGPLVVTQWINSQYYFATVDNAVYGSGSKVTQNPTGNVGVLQGNGGDLLTGLPLQSLRAADDRMYHQPLRLTAVVHAPVERVTDVIRRNEAVAELLANGWLSLTVLDPQRDNEAFHYDGGFEWQPTVAKAVA